MRLIQKWLSAGVLEDGKRIQSEVGTVQGGSVSPLLANIYLHYVFDLWSQQWRKKQARGDVIVVRFADDFVMGFQNRYEAHKFLGELRERFAKFGLELHPDKTRLIAFGRFAAQNREERGERKPATFNFLGFTHICGTTRKGEIHSAATDDAQEVASEAEGGVRRTSAPHAQFRPGTGSLFTISCGRSREILWRAHEQRSYRGFQREGVPTVVQGVETPQRQVQPHLGSDEPLD